MPAPPPDTPAPDSLEALRAAVGEQYAIERLLGQGGMGAVYLARDLTLDRPVAIKIISPEVASHAALRERFLQEARAVARLRHPNIVQVYSAGESGSIAYFVMEFVPGESLREFLVREKRLTGERAERLLREIALALDYAHAQGLVHRDVKPENILLDADSGRAMLMDFGVARAFEQEGGLTQTGMILGSPRYMAPEQASGERAIDGRSDLYALALVGYELYAGAPVVQSGTVASMLVKHLTETPVPLAEKAPDVPPHLAAAIARGLEKDPDVRWQTGRAFAEALAGGALTPSGELRPVAAKAPPARAAQRRIPWLIAAGVVLIAAVAWMVERRDGAATAGQAYLVTPFEVQSGDQSVRWLREGSVNMLTLTLGQWNDLNVINYERTLSLLDAEGMGEKERLSLDDARLLARRAGAGTVVTGQVQTTRDSLFVIARLFDVASGQAIQQAQQGTLLGDDPRPVFDRLAQNLLAIAGGPAPGVQLSAATTSSLEAYRAYLDGVRHLNNWQLAPADSAFARAIALDSTFALAYHKRSLGLAWSEVGGPDYQSSAERAYALAGRLPPRERALVEGHHYLVRGLAHATRGGGGGGGSGGVNEDFNRAISTYAALVARDSMVAEAWYGLADAYYHGRMQRLPTDTALLYATRSLRGFHRTLSVDSTLHLAYSHLVDLYNIASFPGSEIAIAGDSVILVRDPSSSEVQALRVAARARGMEIARAWVRADQGSVQSTLQLSGSFVAAGLRDSAYRVLTDALARPSTSVPALRMALLQQQVLGGDSAAASTLRYVLDHYTPDSLHTIPVGVRINAGSFMITAAATTGRLADVDRAIRLFVATDSTFPLSPVETRPALAGLREVLQLAMGASLRPEMHRAFVARLRAMDTIPAPYGTEMRSGSLSIPIFLFMVSRDTVFANMARRWSGTPEAWPDLDAHIALDRGDTTTAERIAQTFPTPDSLRKPEVRFGAGGFRTLLRADLLARLGLTRQAAETYEALDVARVNRAGLAEPGYAAIVRSLLTRARLWREIGERQKAIAAYEEFLARWSEADAPAIVLVREARQELATLRDAPPPPR